MTKLLNIDRNAKTVKGQKLGFMTAILYLAPYLSSGRNVCPMAELASCHEGCLNTAGRGGIAKRGDIIVTDGGDLPNNSVQRARLARTELYWNDRPAFMLQLIDELERFVRKATRKGLVPVVRLNGTSDIEWELGSHLVNTGRTEQNIFEVFPEVQFYDYTKLPKRMSRKLPANYRLTLSYSGASKRYASMVRKTWRETGCSVVFVMRSAAVRDAIIARVEKIRHFPAVDGDAHDLRFLDPQGARVYLKAKGRARSDTSGFVLD